MTLSAKQLQLGSRIDAKVQKLLREGYDDVGIFLEMADDMPAFKRLLDGEHGTMEELCRRFFGFYRYAKVLETVACGIGSGEIQVPKEADHRRRMITAASVRGERPRCKEG